MSRAPARTRPKPDDTAPPGKREQNRRERLADIERAAVPLLLARGVDGVTVDEIMASARMAKGSFYRYHLDQEALVRWLFAPLQEAVEKAFADAEAALRAVKRGQELGQAYHALAGGLAQVVLANPERVRLYLQEARGPAVGARRPIATLAKAIAQGALALTRSAQEGGLLKAIDPRVSSLAVVGAVERLLHAVLSGEDLGDPLAAADALIGMILDGIRGTRRSGR